MTASARKAVDQLATRRDAGYARSYWWMRRVVGWIGIVLPFLLFAGEVFFVPGTVHVRGSLSAYYHSAMQDFFVGGLCVIGFLLVTYMLGRTRSWDFRVSLVAGIAVLGVVFFPTRRPGWQTLPSCRDATVPPSCSSVEHVLGESPTAVVHAICAVVFILGLAVMSLLFAANEVRPGTPIGHRNRFALHLGLGILILVAGLWAFLGVDLFSVDRLYVGEVVAVWSFGASWLLARDRTAPDPRDLDLADTADPPTATPAKEPAT
ncbi:MAG TPA: hypothetical protein VLM05_16045 [Mycobacteriales bacterium]|nr:hypothetical protein [Mycobacteriales bacterium]